MASVFAASASSRGRGMLPISTCRSLGRMSRYRRADRRTGRVPHLGEGDALAAGHEVPRVPMKGASVGAAGAPGDTGRPLSCMAWKMPGAVARPGLGVT